MVGIIHKPDLSLNFRLRLTHGRQEMPLSGDRISVVGTSEAAASAARTPAWRTEDTGARLIPHFADTPDWLM